MSQEPHFPRTRRMIVAVACSVCIALFVIQVALSSLLYRGIGAELSRVPPTWGRIVLVSSLHATIWAFLSLMIGLAVHRWRLSPGRLIGPALLHLLICVVLAATHSAALVAARTVLGTYPADRPWTIMWLIHLDAMFFANVCVAAGIAAAFHAMLYHEQFAKREIQRAQLEAHLGQARLRMLQMQLQPHFLFNAFNSISALMHQDVAEADRTLARLGDLLRSSLHVSEGPLVSLETEIQFVDLYLAIERTRYGERVHVSTIIDPAARMAFVPHLLLQPLVENAIRHGIAPSTLPCRLFVRAEVEDGRLVVTVEDDGVGLPEAGWVPGIGLGNTQLRLEQLYGHRHSLSVDRLCPTGTRVRVVLPYLNAPELAADTSFRPAGAVS